MSEALNLIIPKDIENLHLPDPMLLDYYKYAEERIFWVDNEITEDTLDIVKRIMDCNIKDRDVPVEGRRPIKIFLNTIGGDAQVMWVIVNAIKISKTPIHTIVYYNALSSGAYILAAGHKRFAFPGATILLHSGSCQFGGDMEKVESAKKYYDALSKRATEALIADTKLVGKTLKRKSANDWFMTAEEALELNIVDKIIEDFNEVL